MPFVYIFFQASSGKCTIVVQGTLVLLYFILFAPNIAIHCHSLVTCLSHHCEIRAFNNYNDHLPVLVLLVVVVEVLEIVVVAVEVDVVVGVVVVVDLIVVVAVVGGLVVVVVVVGAGVVMGTGRAEKTY